MKLLKTALFAATAAAALSGAAMAQVNPGNPASFNATATADILKPLSLTQATPMGFGTVSLTNGNQTGTATTGATETNVTRVSSTGRQDGLFSLAGSDGTVNISTTVPDATCGATGVSGFAVTAPLTTMLAAMSASFAVSGSFIFDGTASGMITCAYTVTAQY